MNKCHGFHPALAFLYCRSCVLVGNGSRLQVKQAADDHQVVFYAVMDLFKQSFLFFIGFARFPVTVEHEYPKGNDQ